MHQIEKYMEKVGDSIEKTETVGTIQYLNTKLLIFSYKGQFVLFRLIAIPKFNASEALSHPNLPVLVTKSL